MAHKFSNGVLENCTSPGTGAATLTGAVPGYETFAANCTVGDTVHYRIEAVNGVGTPTGAYEMGRGTYSGTNTLTRTTVIESSNSNNAVNFSGAVRVSITILSPATSTQVRQDWHGVLLQDLVQAIHTKDGNGNGVTRLTSPGGAAYSATSGTPTGAIKIRLPVLWTDIMMRMTVQIYEYNGGNGFNTSRLFHIGGYNESSSSAWQNTFAYQVGGNGDHINVRFGHDGTYACIWIGETATVWSWPQIAVTEVFGGHSGQATALIKGWDISLAASFGTVAHTVETLKTNKAFAGVMASNDTTSCLEFRNRGGTGDSNMAMVTFHCTGNYAIKMGLRADGYFGIGGWSRGNWSWYSAPNGDMTAVGDVLAYSDPRLKENISKIQQPFYILNKLDGVTFDWRSGFQHTALKAGKHDYGVLADQVESVMPEIVTESIEIDGEKYKTVAYDKLVPVLIEAVKALKKELVELRAELAELRKR
jgi:hypothetical protein